MKRTTAAILIAIMLLFSVAVPVLAQGYQFLCTVYTAPDGNWNMNCMPWLPTPAPTATVQPTATATATATVVPPIATATATALPATPTATATMVHEHPTSEPTATAPVSPLPTPQPTATQPGSPLPTPPPPTATPVPVAGWQCPESAHDKTVWHPHYNAALGCWYDHVHGADPAAIDYRFGPLWSFLSKYPGYNANQAKWQLSSISYPWLTGAGMEQSMKHGGYKWQVADVAPQNGDVLKIERKSATWNWVTAGPYWGDIVAMRYAEHFGSAFADPSGSMPPMFDSGTRFHSFWAEFATADNGKIGGGGWWDTGRFWQYSTFIVPMPGVDPNPVSPRQSGANGQFSDPYRGDGALCDNFGNRKITALWTSRPPWTDDWPKGYDYQHNNHMGLFSVHKDVSACTNRDGTSRLVCSPGQYCPNYNNTEYGPFRVWAYVSPSWDGSAVDRDSRKGYVTFYSWTDRRGLPALNCTAPALDCVPYYAENVRPGWYGWQTHVDDQAAVNARDFDQSPTGKTYINLWGN